MILVAFATLSGLAFSSAPTPKEFHGYWVPQTSTCKSELGLHVEPTGVSLQNGAISRLFTTQTCFSCEGGARYSGIVVWVSPISTSEAPFFVYFNADERRGIARIEITSPELRSEFPIKNVKLKRCKT
jgi:hypothetical protein